MDSDPMIAAPVGRTESSRDLAREVLIHGPISRADLGRRLGLSPASLSRLSRPFIDAGLFVEGNERVGSTIGRPTRPLDVRVDARRFAGIKLTGTTAEGVLTDLRADPLAQRDLPLRGSDPRSVVDVVAELTRALADGSDVSAVGVSVGGNVVGARRVVRAPFLGWRDVDLGGAVAGRLGIPVVVENDVVALTAAEHWFGLGRGLTDFAVVTIGAGVGYGLVSRDRVVDRPDAGLGLGGHLPLAGAGDVCEDCGSACTTSLLTIPGVEIAYERRAKRHLPYAEILAVAARSESDAQLDPDAVEVVRAARRGLGTLISMVANIAMIRDVVLAGEGLSLLDGGRDVIEASIRCGRDPDSTDVRVLVDDSGFAQWARGAAAVAIQDAIARFMQPTR